MKALDRERRSRLHLAWNIEYLSRLKRLPSISDYVDGKRSGAAKAQTPEEMEAVLNRWAAVTGEVESANPETEEH